MESSKADELEAQIVSLKNFVSKLSDRVQELEDYLSEEETKTPLSTFGNWLFRLLFRTVEEEKVEDEDDEENSESEDSNENDEREGDESDRKCQEDASAEKVEPVSAVAVELQVETQPIADEVQASSVSTTTEVQVDQERSQPSETEVQVEHTSTTTDVQDETSISISDESQDDPEVQVSESNIEEVRAQKTVSTETTDSGSSDLEDTSIEVVNE